MKRFFSLFLALMLLSSGVHSAQAAAPLATAAVSGVVTDSGHGYPLYAKITISVGASQVLYTDPFTGAYSVNLSQGTTYSFNVEAVGVSGYEVKSELFIPDSANYTRNFSLLVANPDACTTPGYTRTPIYNLAFDPTNDGFSSYGQNNSWAHGVPTTGPGLAHSPTRVWATNLGGNYNNDENSATESGIFNLSGRRGIQVSWWQWLATFDKFDYGVVEASNNGGVGWAIAYGNEYPWGTTTNGDMSGNFNLAWTQHHFALNSNWAVSNFKVRFRFKSDWNLIGTAAPGWYIDDLQITTCEPVAGGLVGGYVTDANSDAPLTGASVQHLSSGQFSASFATPDDPDVGDGLYFIFVPGTGGATSLTAGKSLYATTSYPTTITPNQLTRLDLPLPPNYDTSVSADQISKAGYPNTTVTYNLNLTNSGFLPGQLLINPVTLPPGPLWLPTLSQHKTGLIMPSNSTPVTVTVPIPPYTPTGTVSTVVLRSHWIGNLYWVLPPGEQSIILTTTALNAPPEAQAQSLTTAEETPLDITLLALDPNGDPVTYEYTMPSHGNLSGTLPFLTYTPEMDYFGTDSFTFTASDGTLSSTDTLISIDITNVNDPPTISTIGNVEWLAGTAHTYLDHPFTDVDGDTLTYTATLDGGVLPAWLSIDPVSGQLSGVPTNGDIGTYEIEISANDGHGGTGSTTFTLSVVLNPFKVFLPMIQR